MADNYENTTMNEPTYEPAYAEYPTNNPAPGYAPGYGVPNPANNTVPNNAPGYGTPYPANNAVPNNAPGYGTPCPVNNPASNNMPGYQASYPGNNGMPNNAVPPVKVKAKSGLEIAPKAGFGTDVFPILISLGLILGGASGRMVLRGTDSSTALIVAGVIFLIFDIISIVVRHSKRSKFQEREYYKRKQEDEALQNSVKLDTYLNVRVVCDKKLAFIDFGPRINGVELTRNITAGEYTGSAGRYRNILNFTNMDLTVVFEIKAATEIVFLLNKEGNDFVITVPPSVTMVSEG